MSDMTGIPVETLKVQASPTPTPEELVEDVAKLCQLRGWNKDWSGGGCYLHLEASEFIEALRGKHGDPVDEAGDVLFTLFAMLDHYDIPIKDVLKHMKIKVAKYTLEAQSEDLQSK